jgi:hypothetical protein
MVCADMAVCVAVNTKTARGAMFRLIDQPPAADRPIIIMLYFPMSAHQSPCGCLCTTRVLLLIMNRPAGFRDRDPERGAGQFERAADRQRLVGLPLRVPFLDALAPPDS